MAYNDPYYSRQHTGYTGQQPTNYNDGPEFDPYNQNQRHPTYDQSGYADDDNGYDPNPTARQDELNDAQRPKEKGLYGDTAFPPPSPQSRAGFGRWRKDYYGNQWTKGSRVGCFFRFFCCTFLLFVFFVISIILSLAIYVRPPDVMVNEIGLNSTGGSAFTVTSSSFTVDLGVNLSVSNPNFFDVDFRDIKVNLTYPLDEMSLGGGEEDGISFKSHTATTFDFPFELTYDLSDDSNLTVLEDLLSKCGITSSTTSDITIDYKIVFGIKVLSFTISPSFSSSFTFACPFSESDLESLLESAGIDLSSVTSALASRATAT